MSTQARIGDLVHFVVPNGLHRPGVLVQIYQADTGALTSPGEADLAVFCRSLELERTLVAIIAYSQTGAILGYVLYDPQGAIGTWHYPTDDRS